MDLTVFLSALPWSKIIEKAAESAATTAGRSAAQALWSKLQPTAREKAIKRSIELFIESFTAELEDTSVLTFINDTYLDQLKQFIEDKAAHEIASHIHPEKRAIDPGPLRRMWEGMNLSPLPEDFDWSHVAKDFERKIRRYIKEDPTLREELNTLLLERVVGHDPGFDLPGYRRYLQTKCGNVPLRPIHSSAYHRQIALWSVFVPQDAREFAPIVDLPRELRLRLRDEGHEVPEPGDDQLKNLLERYKAATVRPVLDILARERLTVILGDPGSGKTSLLKYLAMRWVNEDGPILPIWIDLREYAQNPTGFLTFCDSYHANFGLNFTDLDQRLDEGQAALYLDGLDEILDLKVRSSVIDAAVAFSARYAQAQVVITSRKVGYDPERFTNAGFHHATLEDFDDTRVREFLTRWYETAEVDPSQRTHLLDRITRGIQEFPAIRELSGNPLLLTMMAILNFSQDLPRNRVELYCEAGRVLLHDWDASKTLPKDIFDRPEKEELLRELAGVMQQEEGGLAGNLISRKRLQEVFRSYIKGLGMTDDYAKAIALVEQLTTRNFILCHYGANHFGFVHRTFLEYFCASWFHDQRLTIDQLQQLFEAHWRDEKWHEVLRLIAGMEKPATVEALIQFLMEQDGLEDKYANMMLAAGCLSEVRKRHEIQKTDAALLHSFQSTVIRWKPPFPHDKDQEDEERGQTVEKAMHWIAYAWKSEETKCWLAQTAKDDCDSTLRFSALLEIVRGWKDHLETIPILLERLRNDTDFLVRFTALRLLFVDWCRHAEFPNWISGIAFKDQDPAVRVGAFRCLALVWESHPEAPGILFERTRVEDDFVVRVLQVRQLADNLKGHPGAMHHLVDMAYHDEEEFVRLNAIDGLTQHWPDHPAVIALQAARSFKL